MRGRGLGTMLAAMRAGVGACGSDDSSSSGGGEHARR